MKYFSFWRRGLWSLLSLAMMVMFVIGVAYLYLESSLPDVETLNNIQLQQPLRVYSNDGLLIAEYGEKHRTPVKISEVPKLLINALLATEDQRFFDHPGVDVLGLGRAALQLIRTGEKTQGGSTITMQVARNFFLNSKKTYIRKLNEILLAIKIDRIFSKEKILELYLNNVYLGNRAYGVAAAAEVYYGLKLSQLSLPQMAMIAGLPKAPSRINPLINPKGAFLRRNHVLKRMLEEGYIDEASYLKAIKAPLNASYHGSKVELQAPYVGEMVRTLLEQRYGQDLYTRGYQVYTTIDSRLQLAANNAVHKGLLAYSRRHGYQGPIQNLGIPAGNREEAWVEQLHKLSDINTLKHAVIIEVNDKSAVAVLGNGELIQIPWQGLSWARPQLNNGYVGRSPRQASDVVRVGDLVFVEAVDQEWQLSQLPQVQGALLALQPQNGAIKALVGGFNFNRSNFNRVTQSTRQPGSAFKPFIYSAALSKGYTLATMINDAPVVLDDPSQENLWRPQNDDRQFHGMVRLREGITHSLNLATIRLLEDVGIPYTINLLKTFGFTNEHIPATLSLALGTLSLTPLELTSGYAVIANGGFRITPFIITHITDPNNQTIFQVKPQIACSECEDPQKKFAQIIPKEQLAPRVMEPQIAYLMTLALKSVIQQGTGHAAQILKRNDLAGKTGTTSDLVDAWFAGYNANLVVTTWVGFDHPKSTGEHGAQAALPIWIDFMKSALEGVPESSLEQPSGLVTARIDPKTGLLASSDQKDAIVETFREKDLEQLKAMELSGNSSTISDSSGGDNDQLF